MHPARRAPARAVLVLAVVAVAAVFAARVGGHVGWGVAAAAFLLASVASFLFPTRYRMDDAGVEARLLGATRRRRWSAIHLALDSAEGLLLSPSRRRGLWDPVRTLFLRFDGNADVVRPFVRERALP